MSSASHGRRYRTWHFSHILHTSLCTGASFALGPQSLTDPWYAIRYLFQRLILTDRKPECVVYIHLRVSRAAFDNCVSCGKACAPLPDLPFTGYMQADSAVDLSRLSSWLDFTWEPVGSKLSSHPPYQEDFEKPDSATAAAFVYYPLHGVAALGKGGRRAKGGAPSTAPAVNHCSSSIRKIPMLHWPAYACYWHITLHC